MNTKYIKSLASSAVAGVLLLGAVGCTDKFEDFNTNPVAPTPEQMEGDFASTASLLATMMQNVVLTQENDFQMIQSFVGDEYGRMTASKNKWGTGQFGTYDPRQGWNEIPFTTTMPKIYTPYFQIRDLSGGKGLTMIWANLLRIYATQRVSDCYGPTPYTLVGTAGSSYQVAYDDLPDLYTAMFEDLDATITGLKEASGNSITTELFGNVDCYYHGDITKWVKFANTLKLRMAMRLVNVNPTLAQQKAEEAVNDPVGVISDPSDACWSDDLPGGNSFWKLTNPWDDGTVTADITSYMNGYSDPRLPIYVKPNKDGNYVGARAGVNQYNNYGTLYSSLSLPNVTDKDKILAISASESWFSRAEGALRGWNMGGTAKELYEKGVETSMSERGASIGNYLSSTATPADYVDPSNRFNINAASTICPAYDEAANFDTNLERIIVQKWLGNFPNGWESWADFRRTGYPKWFPVVNNRSTDGVTTTRGMRRLAFPNSEFNTNEANVKAAQGMLGGPDTPATDLWWAKKN